jgi:CRP-like cAMP-binding protein
VLEKYSDFRIVARYRTGEGFGEQALIKTGGRYTASVVAKNVCHLLTLDRALYVQLLAKAHEATLKEKLNYMLNFAIFAPINTKMVNLLCCFHSRLAKRGEYIYRYGTRVHGLYFVVEGEVEIETQEIVER